MTTLQTVNDLQPLFWQLASYLILTACVLVIVAAAFALVKALIFERPKGDHTDALDSHADRAPDASARLGAAYEAGSPVPAMHVVPKGVARVGPARHTATAHYPEDRRPK